MHMLDRNHADKHRNCRLQCPNNFHLQLNSKWIHLPVVLCIRHLAICQWFFPFLSTPQTIRQDQVHQNCVAEDFEEISKIVAYLLAKFVSQLEYRAFNREWTSLAPHHRLSQTK